MPQPARLPDVETVLGEQVGHRIAGLKPVPHVGNIVDPDGAGLVGGDASVRLAGAEVAVVVTGAQILVVGARIRYGLDETLVRVLAEHG